MWRNQTKRRPEGAAAGPEGVSPLPIPTHEPLVGVNHPKGHSLPRDALSTYALQYHVPSSLRSRDDGVLVALLGEHLAPPLAVAAMAHVAVMKMAALEELVLQLVEVVVPLQVAEAAALTLHHCTRSQIHALTLALTISLHFIAQFHPFSGLQIPFILLFNILFYVL